MAPLPGLRTLGTSERRRTRMACSAGLDHRRNAKTTNAKGQEMPRKTESQVLNDDIQNAPDGSLWIVRDTAEAANVTQLLRAAGKTAGKLIVKPHAGRIHFRRMLAEQTTDDAAYELPVGRDEPVQAATPTAPPVISKPLQLPMVPMGGEGASTSEKPQPVSTNDGLEPLPLPQL